MSSPSRAELPGRSVLVELVFEAGNIIGRAWYTSANLFGGSKDGKVTWEHREGTASASTLADYGVEVNSLDGLDAGCGWGGKLIYVAETTNLRSCGGLKNHSSTAC